jgi:hypothetical protein
MKIGATGWMAAVAAGLSLLAAGPAAAWGVLGHQVIALIAYRHLTPAARAQVDALTAKAADPAVQARLEGLSESQRTARLRRFMPAQTAVLGDTPEARFADGASWADAYRLTHPATTGWHFVDLNVAAPDLAAACPAIGTFDARQAPPADECLVTALYRQAEVLRDRGRSDAERIAALRFVVHLVGDAHQPLHAADNGDEAGNCVLVAVPGVINVTSLHAYWDNGTVDQLGKSADEVAQRLDSGVAQRRAPLRAPEPLSLATTGSPSGWAAAWALESNRLAHDQVYGSRRWPRCGDKPAPIGLSGDQRAAFAALAGQQLAKAGLRLADLLNALLT